MPVSRFPKEETMNIAGIDFPEDLYYNRKHDWARVEGDVVVQGLTDFGQQIAQEIVFVEMPRAGRAVEQGETFMSMESGKWVGRIPAMVSGEILEANEELEWEPQLVNESPYGEGWLVKVEMADPAELENLMKADSEEFKAFIEEQAEEYAEILS
jgi:glycine cleavage system H protein